MVVGASSATLQTLDPHVRALDAWRDGAAVADLLESAFREEGIDDGGRRVLHMLRGGGPLESLLLESTPGFVYIEDDHVVGNVNVQVNPTRRDTWIIGNVATHPAHRNRGIGNALMMAAVRHARSRGARHVALQVMEGNAPALHLYEKNGFRARGAVTSYKRASVRHQAVWQYVSAEAAPAIRPARWNDADDVWRITRANVPEELTYAEPFEPRLYQLGLRWTIRNWFNMQRETWFIAEDAGSLVGGARTRINFESAEHHLELMLTDKASEAQGTLLVERALRHFEMYLGKPMLATQARPHAASHAALLGMGFKPQRTLLHMVVDV